MPSHDIIQLTSPYAFADTVGRLLAAFDEKGITVFATIDQQAEARAVGLSMPPTTLIVFGNPRAGTPLMLANPQAGLDLPLKVLVCEPAPGRVDVFYAGVGDHRAACAAARDGIESDPGRAADRPCPCPGHRPLTIGPCRFPPAGRNAGEPGGRVGRKPGQGGRLCPVPIRTRQRVVA